jgi:hypothetical protein
MYFLIFSMAKFHLLIFFIFYYIFPIFLFILLFYNKINLLLHSCSTCFKINERIFIILYVTDFNIHENYLNFILLNDFFIILGVG